MILAPVDQHGMQRPVEIVAPADARASTASMASFTAAGPTRMPALRSARAK
jgi:hypothetical protein